MSELLPCPFCGCEAQLIHEHPELPNGSYDSLFVVRCKLKECGNGTASWFPAVAAVAAWNRRRGEREPEITE